LIGLPFFFLIINQYLRIKNELFNYQKQEKMEQKQQVHNLIILDESGSMEHIKPTIINGFNELVQSIKGIQEQFPNQEHSISFMSFNGFGIKTLHFMDAVSHLNSIDSSSYTPASMTPLYDAMGFSFTKLKNELVTQTNYNVLVTILTDGEENASNEYSGATIKSMIEELSEGNWTFTYIGTDHDVEKMAATLSIKNTMKFDKNHDGIVKMFENEVSSRIRFSEKISENKSYKDNYFTNDEEFSETTESLEPKTKTRNLSIWDKITGKK